MIPYRSNTTTEGRNATGSRALWRATGMQESDFGKPIIAIANAYTQFVPGHVHQQADGKLVAEAIAEAGASVANSTPLPSMTASRWPTPACAIHCRRVT